MKELDCVNILMKMRQLELILSLILNTKQKFLLKFQKKNLISENNNKKRDEDMQSDTEEDELGHQIFNKFQKDKN